VHGSNLEPLMSAWSKADIARLGKRHLFDHRVGNGKDGPWNCQAERLGRLEIDDQLKFGRLKHQKIGRFLAFEDAAGIESHCGLTLSAVCRQGVINDWPIKGL